MFPIPLPEPLPEALQKRVDESVKRFEEQCGLFLNLAKVNGWLTKYREEVTQVAREAFQMGGRTHA